ncbi:MAG: DUF3800 domain-containing protein [Candidatus Acidiferrales bacterium]
MVEAYQAFFDESGTHQDSPLICVAGYLFSRDGAAHFADCWEAEVRPLLPSDADVFHAGDCFHRAGGFAGLASGESERIFDAMIRITKRTMAEGFIVAVPRGAYEAEVKRQPKVSLFIGSAYSLCAMRCVENAAGWLNSQGLVGDVEYIFEAGYEYAGEASNFFSAIGRSKELKSRYRLARYAFKPKRNAPPLQAADLLAWEWQRAYGTAMVPANQGRAWRGTLQSLRERSHLVEHISDIGVVISAMVNSVYGLQSNRLGQP